MSRKVSRRALVLAVRDQLRTDFPTEFTNDSWKNDEIQEEMKETAHPTTGDKYVCVWPGSLVPGPYMFGDGKIDDYLCSVNVSVIVRIPKWPKDRQREAYLKFSESLDSYVNQVEESINGSYTVMNAANTYITANEVGTQSGFHHPLIFASKDLEPRIYGGQFFESRGEKFAALAHRITFDSARRTEVRP